MVPVARFYEGCDYSTAKCQPELVSQVSQIFLLQSLLLKISVCNYLRADLIDGEEYEDIALHGCNELAH